MSDQKPVVTPVGEARAVRERSILRNVYLWMTGGLALTAFRFVPQFLVQ